MSAITTTVWTDKGWGTHLDITQHPDGTYELGLTHVDDVGIDDGDGDGYSLKNLTGEDLTCLAQTLMDIAAIAELSQ